MERINDFKYGFRVDNKTNQYNIKLVYKFELGLAERKGLEP